MEKRICVAVVFGGRSSEHEVSVTSAREVIAALSPEKFHVIPIYISKAGKWYLTEIAETNMMTENELDASQAIVLLSEPNQQCQASIMYSARDKQQAAEALTDIKIDVVFPVLHGPNGEDGTIQGLFKLANIPFVGSAVMASAIAMDKTIMKRLFQQAELPTAEFHDFTRHQWRQTPEAIKKHCEETLGFPCFVKPANLGSSVGISKVKSATDFAKAVDDAAHYDRKILVEAAVEDAREIEFAILGNNDLAISKPGEIITSHEFYDYHAKYVDDVTLIAPADVEPAIVQQMHDYALRAFQLLDCAGYARADFLLRRSDNAIFISELNTIPGFTEVSMFPKLWAVSGIEYSYLLEKLIKLALERHCELQANTTDLEI